MDYAYWLVFFSAALALCISPGPDLIYIVSKTTTQGTRSGIFASAGVCSGAFVHVFAAAFGISAILAASATAFTTIKIIGAMYLFYLGITAIFSKQTDSEETHNKKTTSSWKTYKQGALIDVLNPKVSIFFMAFLPQFVRPELGHTTAQILMLGSLVILVGFTVEVIVVYATSKTTSFFRQKSKHSHLLNKLMGTVLIGLGVRLALSDK
jgi:threonine/homoserine/homoserine lactone efflux protein